MDESMKAYFVEAVRSSRMTMYRAALAILRSPFDAEDAVSSAVEATWKQLYRIRDLNALPAYLIRSAVNAAKSETRRKKKTVPTCDFESFEIPFVDETPLSHYVNGLKDKYRVILLLKYGENLTEDEIAFILHLPRGTVSSRVHRALETLRKEMQEEETGHA